MMLRLICKAAVLVHLIVITTAAQSAIVEAFGAGTGQEVILLSGKIAEGDANSLKNLVEAAVQTGRAMPSLSLNSLGGGFVEGVRLAQTVSKYGLATYVEEGAYCASACFLVFVAGKQKFASYSSRIGVHSGKDEAGDMNRAAAGTEAMGLLLRTLGVSDPIISKMSATPHEKVAWLSTPELQSIGIKPLGFSDSSPLELVLPAIAHRGPHPSLSEADKSWLWNRLVRAASRLSAKQNGGRASVVNSCTSEKCTSSVAYAIGGNVLTMLRTTRDRSGTVTAREVCEGSAAAAQCRPWGKTR